MSIIFSDRESGVGEVSMTIQHPSCMSPDSCVSCEGSCSTVHIRHRALGWAVRTEHCIFLLLLSEIHWEGRKQKGPSYEKAMKTLSSEEKPSWSEERISHDPVGGHRVPGRFLTPGRKAPPLKTSCQGSGRCCIDLLSRRHTVPPGTHLKHAEIPGLSKLTGTTPPVLMSHVKKQDTVRQMLVTCFSWLQSLRKETEGPRTDSEYWGSLHPCPWSSLKWRLIRR